MHPLFADTALSESLSKYTSSQSIIKEKTEKLGSVANHALSVSAKNSDFAGYNNDWSWEKKVVFTFNYLNGKAKPKSIVSNLIGFEGKVAAKDYEKDNIKKNIYVALSRLRKKGELILDKSEKGVYILIQKEPS